MGARHARRRIAGDAGAANRAPIAQGDPSSDARGGRPADSNGVCQMVRDLQSC